MVVLGVYKSIMVQVLCQNFFGKAVLRGGSSGTPLRTNGSQKNLMHLGVKAKRQIGICGSHILNMYGKILCDPYLHFAKHYGKVYLL